MWQAISGIVGGLVSPITNAIVRSKEINEAQHEANLQAIKAQGDRQVALITQGLAADASWEADSIKAGQAYRGFELYVVSIPAIMCFCGHRAAQIVLEGFQVLAKCPTWFQTLLVSIFLANYGYRLWRRNQSDT
jgi:hypothetical protein